MRRNPANESVVEFVVTVRNSMLAAAEVMGAAETAVGKGYAKDFTVRVISEGASPALGIRFIYDSSDNVLDREGKITRILEKAGGHVAGSSHARRNPEGERHTSLKEQAESALLWERIRNAKSQKEALAHYRAALLAAENEQRLLRDRKKAAEAREEEPGYTAAYLRSKGMKRRNPLPMESNPFHPSTGTEFLVLLDGYNSDSMKRIYDAAREIITLDYADGAYVRATTEGGQPALGVGFRYPLPDSQSPRSSLAPGSVLRRDLKITEVLKRAGMTVAGLFHFQDEDQDRRMSPKKQKREVAEVPLDYEYNQRYIDLARKKAGKGREPKALYTKEYLAEKGMPRRNPLDMYRKQSLDGEVYFSVPFANHTATLDIQFDKTDWYRPGAAKTLRVLRTSHMAQRPQHGDLGHYGTLVRRLADAGSLTADDLLTAAIKAEASANDMLNAYPRYKYRDAAHYYEGLTEVLTDLAASLQKGWQS